MRDETAHEWGTRIIYDGIVFAMPKNKKKDGNPMGDLVKAESMIQLAIALPIGCLVGFLFGTWLDHLFHQNWIGIAGIVLGAVGGFLQIIRTAFSYLKKDE
ncbi:MAG: AtpZ/AtpI family protein [Acidobacteriaceae bacterium]|nr:AtpZ/AtpI family protein [Acidobacteriaceae bacterium]